MIASVRGPVIALGPDQVVIEMGGLGISVQCAPGTLATLRVGAEARLATSLVVREDSLTLYGFIDADERLVFELLQTASGVGPRLAQATLAVLSPDELRQAVATEDLARLVQVPGIGRKGAQRIVLEIKDRLGPPSGGVIDLSGRAGGTPSAGWKPQVHTALLGLGWSAREADDAVSAVSDQAGEVPDVGVLLRLALQTLSKG